MRTACYIDGFNLYHGEGLKLMMRVFAAGFFLLGALVASLIWFLT